MTTDATPDGPALHLVPVPDQAPEQPSDQHIEGEPLLARAERIADLPLDQRPAAFDALNRAVVDELHALEEG